MKVKARDPRKVMYEKLFMGDNYLRNLLTSMKKPCLQKDIEAYRDELEFTRKLREANYARCYLLDGKPAKGPSRITPSLKRRHGCNFCSGCGVELTAINNAELRLNHKRTNALCDACLTKKQKRDKVKHINTLSTTYIKGILSTQFDLKFSELPIELVEAKRFELLIRREIESQIPDGHKMCPSCGGVLPFSSFGRRTNGKLKGGVSLYCNPCARTIQQKYNLKGK